MDRCPNVQVSKERWPKRGLKDHDKHQDTGLCPWSRGRVPQEGAGAYCVLRRVVRETLGRQAGLRQARAGLQGQGDQNGLTVPLGYPRCQSTNNSSTTRGKGGQNGVGESQTFTEELVAAGAPPRGVQAVSGTEGTVPVAGILLW